MYRNPTHGTVPSCASARISQVSWWTRGEPLGVGNMLWKQNGVKVPKGRRKRTTGSILIRISLSWFMWTPQVAILSKHVLMFVISRFYAWISVINVICEVRVEPRNHLLILWTEKPTLHSNGFVNSCREPTLLWFGGNLFFNSTTWNSWMMKITCVHDIWPNRFPVL